MRYSWALGKQGIGQTGHWALEEYLTFLRTAIVSTNLDILDVFLY
jgi:hypothetical protein